MKKIIFAAVCLAAMLTGLMLLVGCDEPTPPPEPTPSGPAEYTVTLKSKYGMPLSAVYLLIHDEASDNPNSSVKRVQTDKDGKASFELESSATYTVRIFDAPSGYITEASYAFDSNRRADILLSSAPIDADIREADEYSVGDIVHNLQLTTVGGEKYTVADALKDNELLILNFWYTSCGPCKSEFPMLIDVYGQVKEQGVEIFAIDDNGDPVGLIRDFTVKVDGVDTALPFPTFKADDAENGYRTCELLSKFGGSSYPTTVFIDRAGMICYIHYGVIEEDDLLRAIGHFTAEDYDQATFTKISQIK